MPQLGIRVLNFVDINHYSPTPYVQLMAGQDYDLYFQLIDLSQQCVSTSQCNTPVPYVPSAGNIAGATGNVLYSSINSTSTISVTVAGTILTQAWDTSAVQTVADLANAVNTDLVLSTLVSAQGSGQSLLLTALPGLGALGNSLALSATVTGAGSATPSGPYLSGGVGAGSAALKVDITNINDALVVSRYATQPFLALDATIWKVSLLSTDPIPPGTTNMKTTLTENGRQSFALGSGLLRVSSANANVTQPGAPSGPFFNAGIGN